LKPALICTFCPSFGDCIVVRAVDLIEPNFEFSLRHQLPNVSYKSAVYCELVSGPASILEMTYPLKYQA